MSLKPAAFGRRSRKAFTRATAGVWAARAVLSLAVLLMLTPLLYQLGLSFKAPGEVFVQPLNPLPRSATLENYKAVLERLPMGLYLLNSLLFSFGVTLGQMALSIPAAYAFAYRRFALERPLFALVLLSLMVPFVVTYIPNYLTVASWGLIGTLPGMILPLLGSGYGAFLLRQHFKSFPVSILEAARVDGATPSQELIRVLLPANRAALTSLGVYLFISSWNQFIWPLLVGSKASAYTLTVAVQRFVSGEGGTNWGPMMAAATLATLPTVFLYLAVRRGVLSTFSEGAVKG